MKWGFFGTTLWGLFILSCYMVVQVSVVAAYIIFTHGKISEELIGEVGNNSTAISSTVIACLLVCGPITCGVIKLKKNSNLADYLAFNKASWHQIKSWALIVVGLTVLTDIFTLMLSKPIVPEFVVLVYESTTQPWLLFLALVVAAPVFEEIFFRGFLISGFSSTFIGPIGAILISSVSWAAIHLQYDLYGIAIIFALGIVLGIARLKTNSIVVPIVMHALVNIIAITETIFIISL